MKLTKTICVAALVAAAGLVAHSAQGAPDPTGDTYEMTAVNLPDDYGPVILTFDGSSEAAGSANINETFWQWPGGVVSGETYDDRGDPGGVQHYTDVLPDWANAGTLLEFTWQNQSDGAGIHNNPFGNQTLDVNGIDLNNGSAVPTFYQQGFYFYFMDSGVPLPLQTGQLFFDTDVWVGSHPINAGQEVYYVEYSPEQVDTIIDAYPGGFDFNTDVSREFGAENSNLFTLMSILVLDQVIPNAFANLDGIGFGILLSQDDPALEGDGNGDGTVDGLDYLLWAGAFGDDPAQDPPGSPANGDYDNNGVVDGLDYLVWAGNFGASLPTTAVPEPGTFALAGMALVGLFAARRRR